MGACVLLGQETWCGGWLGGTPGECRCGEEEARQIIGSIWLHTLPDALEDLGNVSFYSGWENRSRSSGGYNALMGIVVHHTASQTSTPNDCNYMWNNSPDRPVGAIYLGRDGEIVVGAAGATNCAGKGGPYTTSKGTIPLDSGNSNTISIEAGNNGTGEAWPAAQQDAYVALVAALCDYYDFDPLRDVLSHFEWAPDRKVDPAGNSRYATGSNKWNMNQFRADVKAKMGGGSTPPPDEEEEVTQEQIDEIVSRVLASVGNKVWTFKIGNVVTGQMDEAADVMRNGAADASRAAKNTAS
jgi:N-acetylmuramoyl-L-alanine amidase